MRAGLPRTSVGLDLLFPDNYDSIISWMLELSLQGEQGLVFHPHQGNDEVFSIHKETFLLLHEHQLDFSQQKSVQSVMGEYAVSGVKVAHIIGGHIQSAGISDYSTPSAFPFRVL